MMRLNFHGYLLALLFATLINATLLAQQNLESFTASEKSTRVEDHQKSVSTCSIWEKFGVYLYCMEISGLGPFSRNGPPALVKPSYDSWKALRPCRRCLISFENCCESIIYAFKNEKNEQVMID